MFQLVFIVLAVDKENSMTIQFDAFDRFKNKVVIVHDRTEDAGRLDGSVEHWGLSTLGGKDVLRVSKGVYRIQGSIEDLTSTDPNAP